MADEVYRGSQSLLDVQSEEQTPQEEQGLVATLTIQETQEVVALLDVLEEVPPIPVEPVQGFQAELGLIYLYNPDAANTLIEELNDTIEEVNEAVEEISAIAVSAMKLRPYSDLLDPISVNTPCVYDDCVWTANTTITPKPAVFNPTQWTKVGTSNYTKLTNKPNFITLADLSCTATGLTYNQTTGVLSLTNGYTIPTSAKITELTTGIATNAANIAIEAQTRANAITTATNRITAVENGLIAETNARTNADTGLSNSINTVSGNLIAHTANTNNPHQVTAAQVGLGNVNNTSDLNKPVSTATQAAINVVDQKVSVVDNKFVNYRTATAQDVIDTQLSNSISTVAGNLTSEATTRGAADAALSTRITTIEGDIPSAASSSNQLADKAFVNSSINNMAAFYITATIEGNAFGDHARLVQGPWYSGGELRTPTRNDYALVMADETHESKSARYIFDGTQWAFQYILNNTTFTQAQIDAINSGITAQLVSSYSAHIVATDNPHNVTASQVGLGNVNNTADMDKPVSTATLTALAAKQDIINDLATIRSGAAAGATAVQPAALAAYETTAHASATYQAKGDYATNTALTTGLATKQDVLTAGQNITIVDNVISSSGTSYTAGANIQINGNTISATDTTYTAGANVQINGTTISATDTTYSAGTGIDITNNVISSTSSVSIDNKSISKNTSDQIQTVGVIDQNGLTTAIKEWRGTLAQYNALGSYNNNTMYLITDDDAGGYSVYTKSEVDTLLSAKANTATTIAGYGITDAYTKTEVDTALSAKANASNVYTKTESDGLITTMLATLYPVGSIYIGTQSTCPMSTLISGSTWTLVSSDRALWTGTGSNGNTTIEAGLPNITGNFAANDAQNESGAFYKPGSASGSWPYGGSAGGGRPNVSFDASRSSSIYGNSTTVQPPAYVVNVWRRTA